MLRSSRLRFGSIAVSLHWLIALGVLFLFLLGLYMTELEYYDRWCHAAPALHKAVGALLFGLILVRWGWRLFDIHPEALATHTAFERLAARLAQLALYGLLVLVPISGYLISTADGQGIDVFGWFEIPALVSGLPEQEDIAGEVHEVLANLLILLAAVHALAAIKHHVFDHDDTLRRMSFKRLRHSTPDEGGKP